MMYSYFVLLGMLCLTSACILCLFLAKKSMGSTLQEDGKFTPTESGIPAAKPAWGRYHIHYYGFALLFLAFDMEMAYMYPWAVVYKKLGLMALADMGVFLMILFLGLVYTWSQGGLRRQ